MITYDCGHGELLHLLYQGCRPDPTSGGTRYLWERADKDRLPEAYFTTDQTLEIVARTLLFQWIARYGLLATITSDRWPPKIRKRIFFSF